MQSASSSLLDSFHDLGQPPADEREAGGQVAIQPLHGEALGHRERVVIDHVPNDTLQHMEAGEALGHREHVVIDRVPHDTPQHMEASDACMEVVSSSASKTLNPDAENFVMKDATLLHGGTPQA